MSKKLTPASMAASTIRLDSPSLVPCPKVMVPRQISDTFRPVRPILLYSIAESPLGLLP